MREARYYIVAGHGFCVEAEAECFQLMENYEVFRVASAPEQLFILTIGQGERPEYSEEFRQRAVGYRPS
jgi:hypothetical protein